MSQVDEQYALVPRWLLETDISDSAIRLYAILSAKYVDGGSGGECWPGIPHMAELVRCSEAKVSRLLTELAEKKAITRQRRVGTSTLTQVHRRNPEPLTSDIFESRTDERFESRTSEVLTKPSNNQTKYEPEKKEKSSSLAEQFKVFYEAYPLHVGRGDAVRAWNSARSKASFEQIMNGLAAYKIDVEKQRAEGFPDLKWKQPGPWLRAERWADAGTTAVAENDPRKKEIERARRSLSGDERLERKRDRIFPYDKDSRLLLGEPAPDGYPGETTGDNDGPPDYASPG